MNLFPRLVAIVLFVLLAALVALLVVPVWFRVGTTPADGTSDASRAAAPPTEPTRIATARAIPFSQDAALVVGALCLGLSVVLLLGQRLRSTSSPESQSSLDQARTQFGALSMLAESSVAQGEELSRERGVRRRAEEDVLLKQQLLARTVDEKIRLGHDLHDGIIQSLYAAGLTLESVRALVKINPDEAERRLDATRGSLNTAIRDVRAYVVGLAPENLRRTGFALALTTLLDDFRAGHAAQFDVKVEGEAAAHLTPAQSIEALQIAREAVSNALRHGRATTVTVRLIQSDQELCLLVQDNGVGFDAAQSRDGGHGLGNMRARADRLGAMLKITSAPGEGVRVLATLPVLQGSGV